MVGLPHHMISQLMGIDTKTLLKYYGEEMADGKARASYAVSKTLYAQATGEKDKDGNWTILPNLSAAIFWTKAQMGWREGSLLQTQQLGADGKPIDPPKLGISFDDGGPGLPRRVPYDQESDERAIKSLAPGADKLN